MKTLFHVLVTVCVIGLTTGLLNIGPGYYPAFFLAMGAVFFILSFATKVIIKAEAEK